VNTSSTEREEEVHAAMGLGGGLLAGLAADAFFGSFAVPIKTPSASPGGHDPVCFQCYKAFTCFVTSWFVLLLGAEIKFTWWGVAGATMWAINGVFGVLAVQLAGISVAQSIWSAVAIFVSFFWGAIVFEEPIKSVRASMFALCLMVVGICGVAYSTSPKTAHSSTGFLREEEKYDLVAKGEVEQQRQRRVRTANAYAYKFIITTGKQKLQSVEFRQGLMCAVYMVRTPARYLQILAGLFVSKQRNKRLTC